MKTTMKKVLSMALALVLLVGVLLILICHWISFLSFRQMTGRPSI